MEGREKTSSETLTNFKYPDLHNESSVESYLELRGHLLYCVPMRNNTMSFQLCQVNSSIMHFRKAYTESDS